MKLIRASFMCLHGLAKLEMLLLQKLMVTAIRNRRETLFRGLLPLKQTIVDTFSVTHDTG